MKGKKGFIIILVVIVLIFLALLGYYFWEENKEEIADTRKVYSFIGYEAKENEEFGKFNDYHYYVVNDNEIKLLNSEFSETYNKEFLGKIEYICEDFIVVDGNNLKTIYKFKNNEFIKIRDIKSDSYVNTIYYSNNNTKENGIPIGIFIENAEGTEKLICNLNGKCTENISWITGELGDYYNLSLGSDTYTYNKDNIVIKNEDNNNSSSYSLLSLTDLSIVNDFNYSGIYSIYDTNYFIAIKDGKAGIIDRNNKILVDFEYDFIDRNNDYYIVSKNDKLAIMDSKFNLLTDFIFPSYQNNYIYILCCGNENTIYSYKLDNMIIVNNTNDYRIKYDKYDLLVVYNDGDYKVLEDTTFLGKLSDNYYYGYIDDCSAEDDNCTTPEYITIYDKNLNPLYNVSYGEYDSFIKNINMYDNNTFRIGNKFYNISDGKEVTVENAKDWFEKEDYIFENLTIKYKYKNNRSLYADIYINDELFKKDVYYSSIKYFDDGRVAIYTDYYYELKQEK